MKKYMTKGLVKYGLVTVMLTLALIAYIKPQVDKWGDSSDCIKIGVAGFTVEKLNGEEFASRKGMSLNELVDSTGISGYEVVNVKTADGKKTSFTLNQADDIYVDVSGNGEPFLLIDNVKSNQRPGKLKDIRNIQCK